MQRLEQQLDERELEQAVMAQYLECDLLAAWRQHDATVRLMLDELGLVELLPPPRPRSGRDREAVAQCLRLHRATTRVFGDLVDRLQVVLHRGTDRRGARAHAAKPTPFYVC